MLGRGDSTMFDNEPSLKPVWYGRVNFSTETKPPESLQEYVSYDHDWNSRVPWKNDPNVFHCVNECNRWVRIPLKNLCIHLD
ncbi:unnamed protein product [Danaus chrysippus]|uniref:(African queen) hypothetical protein n=1 Tax=Danaus chrysippus TaxID=151541 RepID=A0A8J2QLM1_9NEOP|nr:unnamed protein product [Danaus chrysippus]